MVESAYGTEWRAVFWDIGGVILDSGSVRRAHEAFVRTIVERYAPEASVEDALARWRAAVGTYFRERDGTEFRRARTAYDRAVDEISGEPIPEDEWRPVFESVTTETLRPNPGAVEAIERLATETGIHVGVVSDVDTEEGKRILETFGVRERFDSITTSEMVGRTKPDPRMFETGLRAADVPPSDAAMIGDRYEHDVAGASAVGMTAIGYGAEEGPETDYAIDDLREVLSIVGVEERGETDGN
ncbi:HAD family hydrolase (plasmid) [Haladaptatus sp. SPP-AMP-3]|uniref:HAD family hydrolase n=1 Tax=Haladaptatus sp. SPP-AMP-3 TaxID=3121295 RepID=UPI003C2CFEE2